MCENLNIPAQKLSNHYLYNALRGGATCSKSFWANFTKAERNFQKAVAGE